MQVIVGVNLRFISLITHWVESGYVTTTVYKSLQVILTGIRWVAADVAVRCAERMHEVFKRQFMITCYQLLQLNVCKTQQQGKFMTMTMWGKAIAKLFWRCMLIVCLLLGYLRQYTLIKIKIVGGEVKHTTIISWSLCYEIHCLI